MKCKEWVALTHPCTNREGLPTPIRAPEPQASPAGALVLGIRDFPMQGRNATHPEDVCERLDLREKYLPIDNYTLNRPKLEGLFPDFPVRLGSSWTSSIHLIWIMI